MKSMLALNNLPDKQYVHVIWGFSKDFGISGFRCGVLHTWNKEVLGALWWISYFQCVPTSTQCLLLNLINDRDYVEELLKVHRKSPHWSTCNPLPPSI
ncbi:putative inactive 1-aminocyclopropane-1-carboxylate synthase-like protein 2 [Exaiptasia diaphana]|nr:putative inactive 1-aminocyclopropane-1-carboxylate synthase-like protein 2 [Exaiptasia diaphana]